jgi:hypothetical protein
MVSAGIGLVPRMNFYLFD